MRLTAGTSLALVLLTGSAFAADSLKSGPQVGDRVGVFEPLHLTGPAEGTKLCPV
jgi:hypothetical protein